MTPKDEWELEVYSVCEFRDGALNREECRHNDSKGECIYKNCPIKTYI